MKKLLCLPIIGMLLIFVGCSPSLKSAENAARKYIESTGSISEWSVWSDEETNQVIAVFTYDGYYIDANKGLSQDDIDWWNGLVETLVAINGETKATMDETGYIADCYFYVNDKIAPNTAMLNIVNGEVKYDYLSGKTDTMINLDKFNKIKTGMTYRQVCNIIGSEGELISSVDLDIGKEYATEMYVWYGSDGISNATITFQGGKVTAMAQFGLS